MDFKQFYYDLFFDINKSVTRMYTAKQGDTKARGFYVTILQDSVVMPVTTQTMTFYAEKPDKTRTFVDAVKDGDKFRVDLTNQVFAAPGKVKCELTLRGQSGEQISSKTFAMMVDASIQDGSIVSADERGVLDRAFELAVRLELLDVELLENATSEVILARGTAPTLGARLDAHKAEVSAQLAETDQRIDAIITTPVPTGEIIAQEIIDARDGEVSVGAKIRKVDAQLAQIVTLHPNGTDDTTQITNAFTNAKDGDHIRFLSGTHVLKNATTIICNKSVTVEMEEGAIIDATGSTVEVGSPIILINGAYGTFYPLGDDILKGSKNITVDALLAGALKEGDLIKITTDIMYGGSGEQWNTERTYYYKGEIAEVQSVSGSTVTLKNPLSDSYTSANTVACKINYITNSLINFNLKGDKTKGQVGAKLYLTKNLKVNSGQITGTSYCALEVDNAYNFDINGFRASDLYLQDIGNNYGIGISSSQKGVITNNVLVGGRSAITTGGKEPNRFITFENNNFNSDYPTSFPSFGTHGNGEFFKVIGNVINRGMLVCVPNIEIDSNTIIRDSDIGYLGIQATNINRDIEYIKISNNVFKGKFDVGLEIQNTFAKTYKNVTFSNNIILGSDQGIRLYNTHATEYLKIDNMVISNNTINTSNICIRTQLASGTTNKIAVKHFRIGNNIIEKLNSTIAANPMDISYANIEDFIFTNNSLLTDFNTEKTIIFYMTTITDVTFTNNKIKNIQPAWFPILLTATRLIIFKDNTLDGFSTKGGVSLTAPDIFIANTHTYNTSGNQELIGRYYHEKHGINVTTHGTTAPTTGTWKVGDRCMNSNPTVGQPKSWVCTVAGTTGTWVSEGNL